MDFDVFRNNDNDDQMRIEKVTGDWKSLIRRRPPRRRRELHFAAASLTRWNFFLWIIVSHKIQVEFGNLEIADIDFYDDYWKQENFCPEAGHSSCPSNGRKGSFSPIEARARYLMIIDISLTFLLSLSSLPFIEAQVRYCLLLENMLMRLWGS